MSCFNFSEFWCFKMAFFISIQAIFCKSTFILRIDRRFNFPFYNFSFLYQPLNLGIGITFNNAYVCFLCTIVIVLPIDDQRIFRSVRNV